jgi:HEAT repeat protein
MIGTKRIRIVSGIAVILCLLYFLRFTVIFYSCMWLLEYKSSGDTMMFVTDTLERLGPRIVSLLVHTYENTKANPNKRTAAALVLGTLDRARAEALFIKHLEDNDDNIVIEAIDDLWVINSTKPYSLIVKRVNSSNYKMRGAVARYLKVIPTEESILILTNLMVKDTRKEVREAAKYSLGEINRMQRI